MNIPWKAAAGETTIQSNMNATVNRHKVFTPPAYRKPVESKAAGGRRGTDICWHDAQRRVSCRLNTERMRSGSAF
jgi:hypothetical protein